MAAGRFDDAKRHILYFLVTYIAGSLIWTVGEIISLRTEDAQYGHMTREFHRKLINKDMAFYRDSQTGYLATVFRQHLDSSLFLIRMLRTSMLDAFVSIVAPVAVLLYVNTSIGLITLAVVLLQTAYVFWTSNLMDKYRNPTHEIYRKMTGEVADEITNIVAFKAGGVESRAQSRITELSQEETRLYNIRRQMSTLLDLPRGAVTALGLTLAVFVIIGSSDGKAQAIGLVVLTLTYLFQILRSVATLPEMIYIHDDYITKLGPTLKYLEAENETIRDPVEPVQLKVGRAAIDMDKVRFSYDARSNEPKRIAVFDGFDLHIAGGEQVGVAGLSGAGKSTLANLLMRFDEVEGGSIKIDGMDIRSVRQADLRQHLAYVPQEPILFHRTVRENIAYYVSDASQTAIERAAKAAHAHGFIQKLPAGYDTVVGERGVKLSGGQKQRIAIARAILKQAPIRNF